MGRYRSSCCRPVPYNPTKTKKKSWLRGEGERQQTTFIEWVGESPTSFKAIRATLASRVARGRALRVDDSLTAIRVLEDCQELHLLGYPLACIRALVHSLPTTAPAQVARRVVRAWIRTSPNTPLHHRPREFAQVARGSLIAQVFKPLMNSRQGSSHRQHRVPQCPAKHSTRHPVSAVAVLFN